jgi:hypothetical protein
LLAKKKVKMDNSRGKEETKCNKFCRNHPRTRPRICFLLRFAEAVLLRFAEAVLLRFAETALLRFAETALLRFAEAALL